MLRLNRGSKLATGFSLPVTLRSARKRRERQLKLTAIFATFCLAIIITFVISEKPRSGTVTSVALVLPPAVPAKAAVIPQPPKVDTSGYEFALTKGYRAIAIDVDATSGLEGHALPGSRVDVTLSSTRGGEAVTNVIVENARVLSYGGDTRSLEQQRSQTVNLRVAPSISRTITLEMKPLDALQVENARQSGRLGLLMRAPGDIEPVDKTEISQTDVGDRQKSSTFQKRCTKGRATFDGANIIIGCDGEISRVE